MRKRGGGEEIVVWCVIEADMTDSKGLGTGMFPTLKPIAVNQGASLFPGHKCGKGTGDSGCTHQDAGKGRTVVLRRVGLRSATDLVQPRPYLKDFMVRE